MINKDEILNKSILKSRFDCWKNLLIFKINVITTMRKDS